MPDSIQYNSVADSPNHIGIFTQIIPPSNITLQNITVDELSNVSHPLIPPGDTDTYSVTGVSWLSVDGSNLIGTAPSVSSDTNYIAIINKSNSFGSVTGAWIFLVKDLMSYIQFNPRPHYYLDGVYTYPFYLTESNANTVDSLTQSGTGTSHTHTIMEGTYYMPDSIQNHSVSSAPSNGYMYISIAPPSAVVSQTFILNENNIFNQQLIPTGDTATYTISGVTWLSLFNRNVVGTAPSVTSDVPYTLNITKSNPFGSVVGTWNFTVIGVPVVLNYSVSGSLYIQNGRLKFLNLSNIDTINNEVSAYEYNPVVVEVTYQGGTLIYDVGNLTNIKKTSGVLVVIGSVNVTPEGTSYSAVTNIKFTIS